MQENSRKIFSCKMQENMRRESVGGGGGGRMPSIPTYTGSCSSNIQKHTDANIQRKKLLLLLHYMLIYQHTEENALPTDRNMQMPTYRGRSSSSSYTLKRKKLLLLLDSMLLYQHTEEVALSTWRDRHIQMPTYRGRSMPSWRRSMLRGMHA